MLTTSHNILGEKYRKISVGFDIVLMMASFVVLLGSVLDSLSPILLQNILVGWSEYSISIFAAVIFVLSIVEWRVSWKKKSEKHFSSANQYSRIKADITALLAKGIKDSDLEATKIEDRYQRLDYSCVKIPHVKFVRLKRAHMRKIALSKLLDDQPFAIMLILRLRFAMKDTGKGWNLIE